MIQEIYLIDDTQELQETLNKLFKEQEENYKFTRIQTNQIENALKNIPTLIIINEDTISIDCIELCKKIRSNEDNSITPIIVVSNNKDQKHQIEILRNCVEHYITSPFEEEYLYYTIANTVRLLYINRRVSPLTGLPGNVQIQAEMKKRLLNNENFAMLYLDLDNFKSYNDIYGFLQGDEIIKFTARTIIKNVHNNNSQNCFVGHIGGDDFVAIITEGEYEKVCQDIIAEFDEEVVKFFTKEDVEKGYLEVTNRKGIIEQFPLTSISIGVVVADKGRFHNILEIGEVGAQVKHLAKSTMGSTYVIDRRK